MRAIFQKVFGMGLPKDQPPVRAEQTPEEAPKEPINEAAEQPLTYPTQE